MRPDFGLMVRDGAKTRLLAMRADMVAI